MDCMGYTALNISNHVLQISFTRNLMLRENPRSANPPHRFFQAPVLNGLLGIETA